MLDEKTVSQIFDEAHGLYDKLGDLPSNSDDYKTMVKKATLMLEDVTRAVSSLDMFSRNEDISEVPVEHLKFLALPYYLGQLTLRAEWQDHAARIELVKASLVYFEDFLERMENYGVKTGRTRGATSDPSSGAMRVSNMAKITADRNEKMARTRALRELESQIESLRISESLDSPKYWTTLLEKLCLEALDEVDMANREIELLEQRAKMEKTRKGKDSGEVLEKVERRKGWKPVILCRDEAQKKVFGYGYPSLPTLTVAEFYEKRVQEGWYQDGMKAAEAEMGPCETEESKEERKDREEDTHSQAALEKDRNWDEFKDANPRGWGNRHNKG